MKKMNQIIIILNSLILCLKIYKYNSSISPPPPFLLKNKKETEKIK